ncbi:MAG: hypothetical protein PHW04_11135 [Candidatus Wallbacteria bacterium]|nr:hypothetical protein [Candidatus Wallbacteria bacterium]
MKRLILVLSMWVSVASYSGGIKDVLNNYIDSSKRCAYLEQNDSTADQDMYRNYSAAADSCADEIFNILSDSEDMRAVTINFLLNRHPGPDLLFFKRFLPEHRQNGGSLDTLGRAIEKLEADLREGKNIIRTIEDTGALSAAQTRERNANVRTLDKLPLPPAVEIPADLKKFKKVDKKKPTFYVMAEEINTPAAGYFLGVHYTGKEVKKIKTPSGELISETSGRFFASLCLEGSGELKDGRRVTWSGSSRFRLISGKSLGVTAIGKHVVAFHTLAVNNHEMPYKRVYFIPKTVGIKLPTGETLDGYWFSHDTGDAFTGSHNRVDMQVGFMEGLDLMRDAGVTDMKPMDVYEVDSATKQKVYAKYNTILENEDKNAGRDSASKIVVSDEDREEAVFGADFYTDEYWLEYFTGISGKK